MCVCIYIYIHIYVCVCMYMYMCMYVCICVCVYECMYICIYIYIYIYIYIHTYIHSYIHIQTDTYWHTQTHKHTGTQTHRSCLSRHDHKSHTVDHYDTTIKKSRETIPPDFASFFFFIKVSNCLLSQLSDRSQSSDSDFPFSRLPYVYVCCTHARPWLFDHSAPASLSNYVRQLVVLF
jgi:hypothetical protein